MTNLARDVVGLGSVAQTGPARRHREVEVADNRGKDDPQGEVGVLKALDRAGVNKRADKERGGGPENGKAGGRNAKEDRANNGQSGMAAAMPRHRQKEASARRDRTRESGKIARATAAAKPRRAPPALGRARVGGAVCPSCRARPTCIPLPAARCRLAGASPLQKHGPSRGCL